LSEESQLGTVHVSLDEALVQLVYEDRVWGLDVVELCPLLAAHAAGGKSGRIDGGDCSLGLTAVIAGTELWTRIVLMSWSRVSLEVFFAPLTHVGELVAYLTSNRPPGADG
jgi:hypothetical protein